MINFKWADVIAVCAFISGGGLAVFVQALGNALPRQQQAIINISGVVVAVAGLIVRVYANRSGAPADAITADAKVVPAGTTVVHSDTPTVGTNTVAVVNPPQNGSTP